MSLTHVIIKKFVYVFYLSTILMCNSLDLLLTSLPSKFHDIYSPGKLNDHDVVAGTLKVVIPL